MSGTLPMTDIELSAALPSLNTYAVIRPDLLNGEPLETIMVKAHTMQTDESGCLNFLIFRIVGGHVTTPTIRIFRIWEDAFEVVDMMDAALVRN